MPRLRINLFKELPFFALTDFQLRWENESYRQNIMDEMENNGFSEFLKNTNEFTENKAILENCRYFDTDELNTIFKDNNMFKIIHMNSRMLSKNRGKILGFLSTIDSQPDLILLSEIGKEGYRHLNDTFPQYEYEYDVPLNNAYGGIAILSNKELYEMTPKNEYALEKNCDCSNCQVENKWIELVIDKQNYIIGCIYRHPNGNIDHFRQTLIQSLEKIPRKSICIWGGDLNINLIDTHNVQVSNFITDVLSLGFLPKIYLPTRITDTSCTLIDHFFTRLPNSIVDKSIVSGNIFSDITDHLPIFLGIPMKNKDSNNRQYIRILSEKTMDSFRKKCEQFDWNNMNNDDDINKRFDFFHNNLTNMFYESFPLVRKSRKRAKDKKWITSGIRISIRHKNRLYKKKIQSPNLRNITNYKEYKNRLDTIMKEAEENFLKTLFNDTKTAVNRLWKTLGSIINPSKIKKRNALISLLSEMIL